MPTAPADSIVQDATGILTPRAQMLIYFMAVFIIGAPLLLMRRHVAIRREYAHDGVALPSVFVGDFAGGISMLLIAIGMLVSDDTLRLALAVAAVFALGFSMGQWTSARRIERATQQR